MQTKFVPTYQMPSEYDRQAAEARRRQAMAEALEAQAYRPLSGSDAPTPAAAPLVMALQSFLSARQRKKAMEEATKAEETESEYGRRMLGRLQGGYAYQPDKELEQQMAKKPEETLTQYNERMQATPFTAKAAAVPEQTELAEVTRQSQYRKSPDEVLGMAMTPVGTAAMKRAPMLAAALERSMTPAEAEEYYAPTATADGNLVQFGKRGGKKETGFKTPEEPSKPPATHGNLQWNAALEKWESIPGYKPPDPLAGDRVRSAGEDRLRREFDNATKPDLDELSQIGKVKTIFQSVPPGGKPNAIQQDVLVTLLMKFIEPGSVVREGEYDRLVSRQGLVARAQTLLNKVQTGEPLTGEALNQIAGLARLFEEAATNRIRKKAANISTLAGNRNLDINNIILEPSFLQKPIEIGSSLSGKPQGKPSWTPELQSELDALEQKMKNPPGGR